MNIERIDTGDLTATIKIELKTDDYAQKVDNELKKIQKSTNMPGFRPGKVPFGMIKKMYGKSVKFENVNTILTEAINNYVENNNLSIIATPIALHDDNMDIDWENNVDITFSFRIGLEPDFDVEPDKLPEITKYNVIVDDETIDTLIDSMRKKLGNTIDVEVSEETDRVNIDFSELDENGNVLEGGIAGSTMIVPEFLKNDNELFIAVKAGDEIVFDAKKIVDNNISELCGMLNIDKEKAENLTSDFKAVVTSVKRIELAEIDEEFFKKLFPYKTIDNEQMLRENIAKELLISYNNKSKQHFINDVNEMLKNEIKFDLPHDFLKQWLKYNAEKDIDDETLGKDYPYYENTLRLKLIEKKIMSKYNINVEMDDMRSHVKNSLMNSFFRKDDDNLSDENLKYIDNIVDTVLEKEDEKRKIIDEIFETKFFDFYSTSLQIVEKDVTYEEFLNFVS